MVAPSIGVFLPSMSERGSLPGDIAGSAVHAEDAVQLAPAATVPPILVGGMSGPAMRRTVDYADGWFTLPVGPAVLVEARNWRRQTELVAEAHSLIT